MADNNFEDSRVTPRLYRRHQRHARFLRFRHGSQLDAFLDIQATRLSLTEAQVFAKLVKNSAFRIKSAANSGVLA